MVVNKLHKVGSVNAADETLNAVLLHVDDAPHSCLAVCGNADLNVKCITVFMEWAKEK